MTDYPGFERPRVVTWMDLQATLLPYIQGYAWGLDTLGDLWRMGAPDPTTPIGTTAERRILLPSQFYAWWKDVSERMGISTEDTAKTILRGK